MPSMHRSLINDAVAAAESLRVMTKKDRRVHKRSRDYLRYGSDGDGSSEIVIAPEDRMKMADWAYGIVDNCRIDRENVAVAMGMVDRFLSSPRRKDSSYLKDRCQFQLLSMAALYVAIKIDEPVAFGSDVFAAVSQGIYTIEEIEAMEMTLMKGLDWRIHAQPTALQVAFHVLSLVAPHVKLRESTWDFLLDEVRFNTEYSVRDYFFSLQRASTAAMAAIFNSLDRLDREDSREVLRALLSVVQEDGATFPSNREVMDANARLRWLMERDGALEDEEEGEDAGAAASDSSSLRTMEGNQLEECIGLDDSANVSPRTTIIW